MTFGGQPALVNSLFFVDTLAAPFAPEKQQQADYDYNEAGDLRRLKPKGQGPVIAPQEFQEKAGQGVQNGVHDEDLSLGMIGGPENEQQDKDNNVDLPFPYFSRP